MNEDTTDLERIKNIRLGSEEKLKVLDSQINDVQSKILKHPLSAYISANLILLDELKKEREDIQITLNNAKRILYESNTFEIYDLMNFFKELISAFENKNYEYTICYTENNKKEIIETHIISEQAKNYGKLDTISDIIKVQEQVDYTKSIIIEFPWPDVDSYYFDLENPLSVFGEFPYLKNAFEVLISYNIKHNKIKGKEAIDVNLSALVEKYKNLPSEEKDKIRRRTI